MSAALEGGERLFEWRALSPHSWLVRGNGGNSTVIADGRDVLLVDTKELGYGGALRREIQRVLRRAVTRVVSTHHHTDHVMGNVAFATDAPIVAQRRSRARTIARATRALTEAVTLADAGGDPFAAHETDLRDWASYYGHVSVNHVVRAEYAALVDEARGALAAQSAGTEEAIHRLGERFAPTELFDVAHEVRVGSLVVELHHLGTGHTDIDVVVVLPEERVVVAADLVYDGLHPFIDVAAGASTSAWLSALHALETGSARLAQSGEVIVVPGHGLPGDPSMFIRQRAYFDALRDCVEESIREGFSREAASAVVPAGMPAEMASLLPVNLGIIYDEMSEGTG